MPCHAERSEASQTGDAGTAEILRFAQNDRPRLQLRLQDFPCRLQAHRALLIARWIDRSLSSIGLSCARGSWVAGSERAWAGLSWTSKKRPSTPAAPAGGA